MPEVSAGGSEETGIMRARRRGVMVAFQSRVYLGISTGSTAGARRRAAFVRAFSQIRLISRGTPRLSPAINGKEAGVKSNPPKETPNWEASV